MTEKQPAAAECVQERALDRGLISFLVILSQPNQGLSYLNVMLKLSRFQKTQRARAVLALTSVLSYKLSQNNPKNNQVCLRPCPITNPIERCAILDFGLY